MKSQIEKFEKGSSFVKIVSAVSEPELTKGVNTKAEYMDLECIKFIPASGAATRMFKDLYEYLNGADLKTSTEDFFTNLESFPFYEDLVQKIGKENLDKESEDGRKVIVDTLLNTGLNYGSLPKALLKFHQYGEKITTPIDEHIFEGENYLNANKIDLHFTISKEHEDLFNDYAEGALSGKCNVAITYSFQKKETDTLAVDMENKPFKLEDGTVLYRAGGHGSLIENLNDLDGDVIFVKNIDNVCHQNKCQDTIDSKKMLASVGFEVKAAIDGFIKAIEKDEYDLAEISSFMKDVLNIDYKETMTREIALSFLSRPLRVCGMVKNQGEPGGGPFVVDNGNYTDLQICEKAELDLSDETCKSILSESGYFNPVDLVCFVRDHEGKKFNLLDYINEDRYFISEKSYKGRKLKALEHPGLWNGAMHNWNTLFVEVPLMTFNPVKTVNDLLRDGHVG